MYRVLLGAVSFSLRNAFDYTLYSFIRISILQVVATYVALITIRHRDYPSSQSSLFLFPSFPLSLCPSPSPCLLQAGYPTVIPMLAACSAFM